MIGSSDTFDIPLVEIDWGSRLRDIDPAQVEALAESFAEVGLRTPITVRLNPDKSGRKYVLTAGGHRLAAATKQGWPKIAAFIVNESEVDAALWEIDENLTRAELSPADRAMFTFRRKELFLLKHPETAHGGDRKSSRKNCDLIDRQERKSFVAATAELTGKSHRTIQLDVERGEKICEAAIRLLRGTRFNNGSTLDKLKRLPSDISQIAYIEGLLAEDRRVAAENKQVRAHSQKVKRAVRIARLAHIVEKGTATAPSELGQRYAIYYADPPWKYEVWSEETGMDRSAENHYPTMDVDEIIALFHQLGIADPEFPAIMFLWCTNAGLRKQGIRVLEECGFDYVHHWVWDKVHQGNGHWGFDCHECLLIGRRGDVVAPEKGTQPRTVYQEAKGRHSAKPAYFAETIERIWPDLPKLELFCRDPRPGWDAWGFEAGGSAANSDSKRGAS
ncbi:MT-A70 family methyltransferase [Ochrobactrum sp. Marseille-Q0166]|uniref:MT-A70 family methyltransferase n=1 Tax=Ochrobactrum sp. Marseille-Q0166 TaxID=2761105 RepID=UPI00165556C5|nr:MT-A70 family methyltransferase [Ochrobactrum sp. Marseille-Q0166]MBC8718205.1 ParB N-terminal domain-containing protein [Ochrobactrum sp. Marseille-Q0166]